MSHPPLHPPQVTPPGSALLLAGQCPVASLKGRGEEQGQEVTSKTRARWACKAWLHGPGGRPGPQGTTIHDLLVSTEPAALGGLGKAVGRRVFGGAGSLLWAEDMLTPGLCSKRP